MRSFYISIVLFLLLFGTIFFLGFIYLIEPGPEGKFNYVYSSSRLFLHKYAVIDNLTPGETKQLYQSSCTRKCHSTDVIEITPRTAMEWEWIVSRMKGPERADLMEREAKLITEHLQKNFLSNIPTILPEKIMRFLRKHLWKSDFGESDLYLDLIYIPELHRSLIPYLVINSSDTDSKDTLLVVLYINTHQGVIPPWDIAKMATLRDNRGLEVSANGWKVLYEDGQQHHQQGMLSFPDIIKENNNASGPMEIVIKLPGMRERVFQWNLPIPDFGEKG